MKDKTQSPKTNAGPWCRLAAIRDKSERPFRCSCSGTPKHPDQSPIFTQANNLKTCNLKAKVLPMY